MKININLPHETALEIKRWIDTSLNTGPEKKMSHGPLDLHRLATLLLEDVASAAQRPDSRKTTNMIYLLDEHGYRT